MTIIIGDWPCEGMGNGEWGIGNREYYWLGKIKILTFVPYPIDYMDF